MTDTFPRQYARTQRLSLGEPRTITVSPDGERVVFLRSRGGGDAVTCLWVLDVATGEERLIADPLTLLVGADEADLPPAERARRERARESAGGVVSYATDRNVTAVSFALAGRLFVGGLLSGRCRELAVPGPVFDPRPDPTARRLAYVSGRSLRIAGLDGASVELAGPDAGAAAEASVSWGSAEFVAAEEMGRSRGYWWSPDGEALVVARVDTAAVPRWWIADPARPERTPAEHAYPAAGTTNADVRLFVRTLAGRTTELQWDRADLPYVTDVVWDRHGILLGLSTRDQKRVVLAAADPVTGAVTPVWTDVDDAWVELVPGVPRRLADGRLVVAADRGGTRRILVDGTAVTPPVLQVRSVLGGDDDSVLFAANDIEAPEQLHIYRWSESDGLVPLTHEAGVHTAWAGGGTTVLRTAGLDRDRAAFEVIGGPAITSHAEVALATPNVRLLRLGRRRLPAALLLPHDCPPDARLPVLLDPYGGPHAQRVVASRNAHASSQWFADQGFAVLVIDGRGTPGLGSEWERAVHLDLAGPVLDDQIDGLHAAAEVEPRLDLSRVGIRGWSFGGYLAALAVLRRPDAVHAAVAGAPVTEWRLYDTHYTERYLGNPTLDPAPYDRSSLLPDAARLERPLLLIHGLADDNVVAAHTLQLSSALLAAGRPHQVLPLSGVTHMTPQEVVAENLLLLQLTFLRTALG